MTTMGCKRDRESTRMDAKLKRRTPLRNTSPMKRSGLARKAALRARVGLVQNEVSRHKWLCAEIDRVHGEVVRAGGACVVCGTRHITDKGPFVAEMTRIECGHLFERRHKATRWDVGPGGNCHPQCHRCNQEHENNPEPFLAWFTMQFGAAAHDRLVQRKNSFKRWSVPELVAKLDVLRKMVSRKSATAQGGGR